MMMKTKLYAPLIVYLTAAVALLAGHALLGAQQPATRRGAIIVPFKLDLRGGYCQNATAFTEWSLPATNPAVAACNQGTNTMKGTLDFADGANSLSAQYHMPLPSDWVGAIDVAFKWYAGTATSGAVVWQFATICVADAATSDPAFNAASTVTDTAKGTVNQDNDASITAVTITGCTAGKMLYMKVFRDPANGADTMADTAHLRSVEVTYRRGI